MELFILVVWLVINTNLRLMNSLICSSLYTSSKECFPCPYYSYPNHSFLLGLECVNKSNNSFPNREVLIINNLHMNSSNLSKFIVYSDFIDAFTSETQIGMTYRKLNITFYFTYGNHYNRTKNSGKLYQYFRRVNANITLKPLFCSDYFTEGCVNSSNDLPCIYLKTLYLNLFVSASWNIENLNFFGVLPAFQIDTFVLSFVDLNQFLIQRKSNAFLNLEAIFDDPLFSIPNLSITNVSFNNFIEKFNKNGMSALIESSIYGGKICLKNVTLINIFLYFSIFLFSNNNFGNNGEAFDLNLYQIQNFDVKICGLSLYNEFEFDDNIPFFLIYMNNWLGNINFENIILNNLNGKVNFDIPYAFYFTNILQAINIKTVYIQNITNYFFIYGSNSSIIIENIFISNYYIENNYFLLFSDKIKLSIDSLVIENPNSSKSAYFLKVTQADTNLTRFKLINSNYGCFYISESNLTISNSLFLDSAFDAFLFLFDKSNSIISNCIFKNIASQQNIFLIYGNNSEIVLSDFSEISCSSIILPIKTDFQILDFCLFHNLSSAYNVWGYNSILFVLIINNTQFLNSTLFNFLFIPFNQLQANFNNLSIINIEGQTSNIFISILTHSSVIMTNCNFINMFFYETATHLLEIDFSTILFDNCNFINVGWKRFNIDSFLSSEDNNILYFWNFNQTIILNSNFYSDSVSLFSGFLFFTIGDGSVILINNSFKASNHTTKFYYQGIVISDAALIQFDNNIFEGLICTQSIFNNKNLRRFNGPISLNGESGNFLMMNEKKLSMKNNSFHNCSCLGKGGSFCAINYKILNISLIECIDSNGTNGGCFFFVGIQFININNLFVKNVNSNTAAIQFDSITEINLQNSVIKNIISKIYGAISSTKSKQFSINKIFISESISSQFAGSFSLDGGNITITNLVVFSSISLRYAGVMYFTGRSKISVQNAVSISTSAYQGGFIYANGEINCSLQHIIIFKSFAYLSAALHINDIKELDIDQISVINCITQSKGTINLLDKGDMVMKRFNNLQCFGNYALSSSCFSFEAGIQILLQNFTIRNNFNSLFTFLWPNYCFVSLFNFSFINNSFENAMISVENIVIYAKNMYFENNTLNLENPLADFSFISLTNSHSHESSFEDIIISQNDLFNYNFSQIRLFYTIFSLIETTILIKNFTMHILIFDYKSFDFFFILGQGSENIVSISECILDKTPNKIGNYPGLITMYGLNLTIAKSIFNEILDVPIVIYNTNFHLSEGIFKNNLGIYDIYASIDSTMTQSFECILLNSFFLVKTNISFAIFNYLTVSVKNSIFNNSNFFSVLDQSDSQNYAFSLIENLEIEFFDCVFSYFSSYIGGALKIQTLNDLDVYLTINKTIAICNIAYLGGFLSVYGHFYFQIDSSIFFKNKAIEDFNNSKFTSFGYSGFGGVIIYQKIMDDPYLVVKILRTFFLNNSAAIYSPTILSEIKILYQNQNNNTFIGNIDSKNEESEISGFPSTLKAVIIPSIVVSGVPFDMSIEIIDDFNKGVFIDFNSSGTLKPNTQDQSYSNSGFMVKNFATSKSNFLNFSNMVILSKSGQTLNFFLEVTISDFFSRLYFQNTKYISLRLPISLYLRKCEIGEILTPNLSCSKCPHGTYSFFDPMNKSANSQKCSLCLQNADCDGGNLLIPMEGYWIYSNDSELIVECELTHNCINIYNYTSKVLTKCKKGTKGNLCYYCEEDYAKSFNNECLQCDGLDNSCLAALILATIITMIFIVSNTVIIQKSNQRKTSKIKSSVSIIVKIFINFMHHSALIVLCNKKFLLKPVTDLMSEFQTFSLINANFLTCQCLIPTYLRKNLDIFTFKYVAILLLPFFLWFICFIYFLVILFVAVIKIPAQKQSLKKKIFQNISVCFVICVYILYPLITRSGFSFFNCQLLSDKIDKTFLVNSPDVVCWEKMHWEYLLLLSVPGLFIWSLSFPTFIFIAGIKRIYLVKKIKEEIERKNQDLENTDFKQYFSKKIQINFYEKNNILQFFTENYKTKYCYWDALIFFRKFFVTLVMSLCASITSESSTVSLMGILYFGLSTTLIFKPYKYNICNSYEMVALSTNLFTIMTSFFVNIKIGDFIKLFLLAACLVANLSIIIFCFVRLFNFAMIRFKYFLVDSWGYFKFLHVKLTFPERRISLSLANRL